MDPLFFATPADFRAWLEAHHDAETVLWVGYYKKATGTPSLTWPESVDQALCFGWIDGVRQRIDDEGYMIRFTPRRSRSTWSAVNIRRMGELMAAGLAHPAGLAAFEARREDNSELYSYEQRAAVQLDQAAEGQLRANAEAWAFFEAQPKWYRKAATWWVVSAKKEETRQKRLATLIAESAAGRTIGPLTRPGK